MTPTVATMQMLLTMNATLIAVIESLIARGVITEEELITRYKVHEKKLADDALSILSLRNSKQD